MLNKDLFEFLKDYGFSHKQAQLTVICALLVITKFLIVPVVQWQSEKIENKDFYRLQIRGEDEINESKILINENIAKTKADILSLEPYYLLDESSNSAQIKITEKVEQYTIKNNLDINSRSSTELLHKEGVTTLEFTFEIQGYAESLQQFVLWVESQEPVLVIKSLNVRSPRSGALTIMRLRFQAYVYTKSETDENE